MHESHDGAEFLHHEPCPECGSQDNLARYSDGHADCFGCEYYEKGPEDDGTGVDNSGASVAASVSSGKARELIEPGEVVHLSKRGITEETCKKFGYSKTKFSGKTVQVAPFKDASNKVVAQKLRFANKDFTVRGSLSDGLPLWGQWLWRDSGRKVVVTEGEIDAMSVSQMQGNKWPVVSVPNGAQGAAKSLAKAIEWLTQFEQVIIMFDDDEPGRDAAEECAALLPPGLAKIATIPGYKDANEALVAGDGNLIIDAIWGAKEWRPDGVVSVSDVWDEAIAMPTKGLDWPWPSLTELTYGIHRQKAYYLGAGVGIGKTDWAKELQSHLVNKLGLPVGVFMLEESTGRTLKGLAGKFAGKQFHKPDGSFTQEELEDGVRLLEQKVWLYNHKGSREWDEIKAHMRYMVQAHGIKDIFLDNLTCLVSHLSASDANDEINRVSSDVASMIQELDFTLYGFSHLNPAKNGEPHERGGKVYESQFTGSRGLMRYGHYLFGIERNKDPELSSKKRNTSQFVLLKDREFGEVGMFPMFYDREKGTYLEPNEDQKLTQEELNETEDF